MLPCYPLPVISPPLPLMVMLVTTSVVNHGVYDHINTIMRAPMTFGTFHSISPPHYIDRVHIQYIHIKHILHKQRISNTSFQFALRPNLEYSVDKNLGFVFQFSVQNIL